MTLFIFIFFAFSFLNATCEKLGIYLHSQKRIRHLWTDIMKKERLEKLTPTGPIEGKRSKKETANNLLNEILCIDGTTKTNRNGMDI